MRRAAGSLALSGLVTVGVAPEQVRQTALLSRSASWSRSCSNVCCIAPAGNVGRLALFDNLIGKECRTTDGGADASVFAVHGELGKVYILYQQSVDAGVTQQCERGPLCQ